MLSSHGHWAPSCKSQYNRFNYLYSHMNILNFDFKKTEKTHKRLDRTWSRVLFYYKSSSFQHEVKVCTINSKEQKKTTRGIIKRTLSTMQNVSGISVIHIWFNNIRIFNQITFKRRNQFRFTWISESWMKIVLTRHYII